MNQSPGEPCLGFEDVGSPGPPSDQNPASPGGIGLAPPPDPEPAGGKKPEASRYDARSAPPQQQRTMVARSAGTAVPGSRSRSAGADGPPSAGACSSWNCPVSATRACGFPAGRDPTPPEGAQLWLMDVGELIQAHRDGYLGPTATADPRDGSIEPADAQRSQLGDRASALG
jgi:hypothetical protein